MRHRVKKSRLNRFTSWRKATLNSMSRNLLIHQSVRTTKTKAKAVKPLVERLITLAKKDSLKSKRLAFAVLQDHSLVKLLFSEIAPRFHKFNGGYCRILPAGFRRGDGASLVILELTQRIEKKKPLKKEEAKEKPKEEAAKPTDKPTEKPPSTIKPKRKFMKGLRKIFKKERDSL
ncbi:50S ribosomal protein L17 [Candidatus Omnitrophota bacterium]